MKLGLLGIFTVVMSLVFAPLMLDIPKIGALQPESEVNSTEYKPDQFILPTPDLVEDKPLKTLPVRKVITLEDKNTVVFRGPVTRSSVGKAMMKLRKASQRVSSRTPIYLVLDTPGGSVFDGLDFIDFAKALPQEVHTVTLFAASMGFQIAQNLEERYIIRNGTLMSHRASLRGLGGQIDGELESRYRMIRRAVDYLDMKAATRMGMEIEAYKEMIYNEYWVHGYDAVNENAADQQVLVRCGRTMNGEVVEDIRTMFGVVKVTFAKCPLIKAPLKIDFSQIVGAKNKRKARETMNMALTKKREFVKKYITTNRFYKIFQ